MANEATNVVLPVYMVIDSSLSMGDKKDEAAKTPFRAALDIVEELHETLEDDIFVRDRMRTQITFFDKEARESLPLSEVDSLEEWYETNKDTTPIGITTSYHRVFNFLKTQIDKDMQELLIEGGRDFSPTRPLVIFLTDGKPMEKDKSVIDEEFRKLTGEDNKFRPNIICIGVGDATRETLGKYAAGTIHDSNSDRKYVIGNPKLSIFPQRDKDAAAAISKITDKLVRTIVLSVPKKKVALNSDGIAEVIVPLDDMFKGMM